MQNFLVSEVVPLSVILSDMKGCQVYLIFKDLSFKMFTKMDVQMNRKYEPLILTETLHTYLDLGVRQSQTLNMALYLAVQHLRTL